MFAGHKTDNGRIQPLKSHLENVAKIAGKNAESFNARDMAYQMGLAHDIGKYSKEFQKRIMENGPKVDHSTAGGRELLKVITDGGILAAYGVIGHHSGLLNGGSQAISMEDGTYFARMKKENLPDYSAFAGEIELKDAKINLKLTEESIGFSIALYIRMLYSALVDADYLDTENFMTDSGVRRGNYEDIKSLYKKHMKYIDGFSNPKSEINIKRNEILKDCLKASEEDRGLYSLTVPTGGGKTLASLGFALSHAVKNKMDRIIYVIPYTSIIDQNAAVMEEIFGKKNVVQHHSNITYDNTEDEKDHHYLATENWDAPIIVTTNVQFFESLFANRNSRCRKLHNISNSVIIFDEAQMIPTNFLKPCTAAIGELIYNYNCTAVLCTATQPALDSFFKKELKRKEICRNPKDLYEFFRRNEVEDIGQLDDEELVKRLQEEKQVLAIVNTRKQAQNIHEKLKNAIHLSTLMYPVHRKEKIKEIKNLLKNNKDCRVVSTSLIEAGVDLDFPTVYRGRTGLDSIVQAAGRCNREQKRETKNSKVYVFKEEDSYKTPLVFNQPREIYNVVRKNHEDISTLEAIGEYFERITELKGEAVDAKNILKRFNEGWQEGGNLPFKSVAKDFKIIDSNTYAVLIPIEEEAKDLETKILNGVWNRDILRKVGMYSVNIYENHLNQLFQGGMVEFISNKKVKKARDGLFILRDLKAYSKEVGLILGKEASTDGLLI